MKKKKKDNEGRGDMEAAVRIVRERKESVR